MSVEQDLMIVVESEGLGEGEIDLGAKLIKSYLAMLAESGRVPARMIFLNSGVFLTTAGSPVLESLADLAEQGTEIFSCGTCLAYYGREEKLAIGAATNMKETVAAMLDFGKVITL